MTSSSALTASHNRSVSNTCNLCDRHLHDSSGSFRVLVVDGGGSLRCALVGGNIAASAAKNGWAGIVVEGCVRDSAELAEADVGIRALALMPLPTDRKNQGLRDGVLSIQGITVRPGEWLVADEDRIVVLPTPP